MEPLRIGVIATGNAGRGHIRNIEYLSECRVVAVADSSPEQLREGLKTLGRDVPAFSDYRRLLDRSDVEAVAIALPPHLHCEATVAALEAGKHVLCEKVMALTLAECDRMMAAARKAGKVLQIGLELRSAPLYRKLHELTRSGRVGEPRMLWCHEFRLPFYKKVDDWLVQKRFSGGTLVDKNCHHFDLFNWLAGAPPTRVAAVGGADVAYASGGRNPIMDKYWGDHRDPRTTVDVLDNAWVMVEYENGVRACLGVCLFSPFGNDALAMGVIGSQGQLRCSESRYEIEQFGLDGADSTTHRPRIPSAEKKMSHNGAVLAEYRAFVAAIRSGAANPVGGEEGRLSLAVALAAEKAVAERRFVELSELL
jgi:predicted dehydrogenase